ncbi:MAG: RHS repeat-associated core domain-containing protein, partial [Gammaproteobacteria bacterium]|nr:RHS repeat-associated core domain-containing protein [Gammaproteobacteria bacterium]
MPVQTAMRYTGQRFDEAIGLYYYNARYYDPAL